VSAATPEPPPPPPSGSPFGRFPTQLVGLVAVAAAGVAAVSFSMSGGGNNAGPAPPGITGTWESVPASDAGGGVVQLELSRSGGTLTAGGCTGELTPRGSGSGERAFRYVDTSGERGCPRVLRVDVSLAGRNTLRVEARRRGGRELFTETLRRVG
jgi:hypothetical protein